MTPAIRAFLAAPRFAVVGASTDRTKYGNKVLRCYMQNGREVVPVNPRADEVEGLKAVAGLAALGDPPPAVSVITPPAITVKVIEEAAAAGIRHVWLQPGAESPEAIERAKSLGLDLIHSGPCVLVVLGFHE